MKLLTTIAVAAGAALASLLSASVGAQQPAGVSEDPAAGFGGVESFVRASRDATLSFTFPVEIGEVLAHGGQRVKKGDLLIQGRDDETRAQRDLQKAQAESDLDIQKAQVAVDQAQVEYEGQARLEKKDGGSEIELKRAAAVLAARKVELELAKFQYALQAIQLKVRQAQLDRFAIRAPFDGTVDNVLVDVGEVKKDTEPVLKIVGTDPLWMDVNTPTEQSLMLGLKPGDKAWVVLELPGEPAVQIGKVIEVGAKADFSSRTRRVRVELPNPTGWPAGIGAWVRFTAPEGDWAKRVRTASVTRPGAEAGLVTQLDLMF